jgi:hypothetical protein
MPNLEVRIGVPEDMNEMMRLSVQATAENAMVLPSVLKLAEANWGALTRQTGVVGVIGGHPGRPLEAAILMHFGTLWYSDEIVLEEKAIFVDPMYRAAKGGRARKLTDFAKKISDSLVVPLAIGVLSNDRTEAKMRLYERAFGKPTGIYFLYGAHTGIRAEQAEAV